MTHRRMSSTMTLPIILLLLLFSVTSAIETNSLCIAVCMCEQSETDASVKLDCSRVYLSILPPVADWPVNTTHMDVSFNNITHLDTIVGDAKQDTLEVLDLSHNRIRSIAEHAFSNIDSLKYLNLGNNDIRELPTDLFKDINQLKSLNLSSNGMHSLPSFIFYDLTALEELSLADNPFIHIDPSYFKRLAALRWIDLSSLGMYDLPANMFHAAEQLEFLDLSSNDFHDVPTDALRSVKKLKHLRFDENPIEFLDKKSFTRLSTLEVLEINNMDQLKEVKEETFSSLTNLQTLEMRYNRHLTSIDSRAFTGLFNGSRPNLQELDLEGNRLQVLDENVVSCKRMRKFNLQKNPWTCDCRMKWIKDCQIQKIYAADLKCYEPFKVFNVLIIDMNEEDFECNLAQAALAQNTVHEDHVVRTVSVGMAAGFLVVLALGIALIFKWRDLRSWYRNKRNGPGAVYYVRARANP